MVSILYVHINFFLVPSFPFFIGYDVTLRTSFGISISSKFLVVTTEERDFVLNPIYGRFLLENNAYHCVWPFQASLGQYLDRSLGKRVSLTYHDHKS